MFLLSYWSCPPPSRPQSPSGFWVLALSSRFAWPQEALGALAKATQLLSRKEP